MHIMKWIILAVMILPVAHEPNWLRVVDTVMAFALGYYWTTWTKKS